jgi:hypothetical protein
VVVVVIDGSSSEGGARRRSGPHHRDHGSDRGPPAEDLVQTVAQSVVWGAGCRWHGLVFGSG